MIPSLSTQDIRFQIYNRVQVEHFAYEKTFRGRMQLYLLQNQRTSFLFRMLNISVKVLTCVLYVMREMTDCENAATEEDVHIRQYCKKMQAVENDTTTDKIMDKTFTPQYELLFFVDRPDSLWLMQTSAAVISLSFTITHMAVHHKGNILQTLASMFFLIELVTSFPYIITIFFTEWRTVFIPTFINCWIVKTAFHNALRDLNRSLNPSKSILSEQLIILMLSVFCIFFTGSCGMTHLQRAGDRQMSLFESFYFIVVTFSTVGYGDFAPDYWASQLYICLMIVFALISLPVQIDHIIHTLAEQKKSGGNYSDSRAAREKHVVLSITLLKADVVHEFLQEFYAHYIQSNYFVLLLTPSELDHETKMLLQVPRWQQRVIYMRGTVLKNTDMERAKMADAEACFILSARNIQSKHDTDHHTILRSWAVKDFAPDCKQYVMVFRPDTKMHLRHAEFVVCEDEFKYALLSNNCICPGISSFITLLLHTSTGSEGQHSKDPWHRLYGQHSGNEVYSVILEQSKFFAEFAGKSFIYASFQAHRTYGVSLVGVKKSGKDSTIELNPGRSHIMQKTDTCYYISITREELIQLKDSSEAAGNNLAKTIAGIGAIALEIPHNDEHDRVSSNASISPSLRRFQFAHRFASNLKRRREESNANRNNPSRDRAPVLAGIETSNQSSAAPTSRSEKNVESMPLLEVPQFNRDRRPSIEDVLPEPEEAEEEQEEEEEEYCDICHGRCVENDYVKSFLPVTPYIGTSATLCYLVQPRRPICCLELNQMCEHSQCRTANEYEWQNSAIILAADHASNGLYNFIIPLRAHYRDPHELHPIVMLLAEPPDSTFLEVIAWFPMVYYMIGSFDSLTNQLRAGILLADFVVVVNKEQGSCDTEEFAADSNTIISVQTACRFFPNVHMITELTYYSNMRFMQFNPKDQYAIEQSRMEQEERNRGSNMAYMFRLPFAAGKVFSATMLDTLLYQAYAKTYLLRFVRLLLGIDQAVGSGYLDAIRLTPEDMWIRTYGRLYQKLCSSEACIPIGIYRTLNVRRISQQRKELTVSVANAGDILEDTDEHPHLERKFTCRYLTNERQEITNLVRYRMENLHLPDEDYCATHLTKGNVSFVIINPNSELALHENDIIYVLRVNRTMADVTRNKRIRRRKNVHRTYAASPMIPEVVNNNGSVLHTSATMSTAASVSASAPLAPEETSSDNLSRESTLGDICIKVPRKVSWSEPYKEES